MNMNEREMVKKIWATLWGISDPKDDYVIGYRWVKKHFKDKGAISSEASVKRFDKAWEKVRKKMRKMAK